MKWRFKLNLICVRWGNLISVNQSPKIENIFAVLSIKIIKLRCETNQLGANKFLISTLLGLNAQDFKLCLKLFDIYYISITRLPGCY